MALLDRPIDTTVCGSFRRHLAAVQSAVAAFKRSGVRVLSPSEPTVVDAFGDFVFVESDLIRTIKPVEDRHLSSIRSSDFVWLVAPDGYVGPSAALEIGFALAAGVPVLGATPPSDLTIRQYVDLRPGLEGALASPRRAHKWSDHLLIDPVHVGQELHQLIEVLTDELLTMHPDEQKMATVQSQLRNHTACLSARFGSEASWGVPHRVVRPYAHTPAD